MPEGEDHKVPSFFEQMKKLCGEGFEFGEFKPHTHYHEGLNYLEYIEEDCCTVTEHIPGSNIELMRKWDGEKYCGIVGIKIWGFHTVAPPEVVEAYRKTNEAILKKWRKKSGGVAESG